ncbi:hypothetical protein [uncultured Paludibaculum sp.]|uniref:hypothetical protein n=1 Tax=uncultured Paludibaculum sp. TaxID=1765020 RepID=UPI002AAA87E7|nr:hypothetical protein [uncultured Paludibaculum sp.]
MAEEIRTKDEFYRLYNRGAIGNMLRNWTVAEWAGFRKQGHYPVDVIAARCTQRTGVPVNYDLRPADALDWVRKLSKDHGVPLSAFQFAECAPDHTNTLQGEVMRDSNYLALHYCLHGHKRMRYTLTDQAIARHAGGLEAVLLLKRWMDAASWDTLQSLWDRWPDAMVEFCCYEKPVGVLQTNTLIWECRTHY